MEKWLQERNARLYPESAGADQFKILGYQWRVMRFNDHTRQSTAKVMTCYRTSGQRSLFLMQQPHVLAVPCEFTCTSCMDHDVNFALLTSSVHLHLLIFNLHIPVLLLKDSTSNVVSWLFYTANVNIILCTICFTAKFVWT